MNKIVLGIIIILILFFFSCMIAGDVFISKIAFNTFKCTLSLPDTTTTTTAVINAPTTTAKAPFADITYDTCVNLDSTQLNFAQFRIIMLWIILLILIGVMGYVFFKKHYIRYDMGKVIFAILAILLLFIFVGAIFISQFVFQASKQTCNNSKNYCYDLNTAQIGFARMVSIFSFITTFALTGLIVFAIHRLAFRPAY